MISPTTFQDIPFGNRNALLDFWGYHFLWHRVLADTIFRLGKPNYRTYPLGDGGLTEFLLANQAEHVGAAGSLGIAGPPDLQSFNLRDEAEFSSWTFLHAADHRRLQIAAGVP